MSERYCPTTGKERLTADLAVELLQRRERQHKPGMCRYRCMECGSWHLGTPMQQQRKLPILRNKHSFQLRYV